MAAESQGWTRPDAAHLAGPVVAAAVVFPVGVPAGLKPLLDDSKKLSAAARQAAFDALQGCRVQQRSASRPPRSTRSPGSTSCTPRCSPCAVRCSGCQACPTLRWSTAIRRPTCPAGSSAASAATRHRFRSRRRRSSRRCARPRHGAPGNPLSRLRLAGERRLRHASAPAALHRVGPCRHHRAAFGTVRLLRQARCEAGAARCGAATD